jgi:hypothetical protein
MIRVKLLAVLAGMIATLAVSAAPAFAEFESLSAKVKGLGQSGPAVLEGGGATLECASTQGEWTIFSGPGGKEATKGTVMRLTINTWNGCTAKSTFAKGVKANVKECTLELEQAAGSNTAKGSTVTECTVEVKVLGTCIISTPGGQKGLVTNTLTNVGQNLEILAEDSGITTEPKGSCFGISKTTNAKEKATFIAHGARFV